MRRRAWLAGLAALAVALGVTAPAALASLLRALDLRELTLAADQIVVAEVLTTNAAWDGAHRTIHTTIEAMVRESWKGQPPGDGRIALRQLGGRVGDIEMTVHGMATFAVGERALLFLRRAQVVGMAQGKRTVRWETSSGRWRVEPAAREELARLGQKVTGADTAASQTQDLDELRSQVRSLLRGTP